MAKKVVDFKRKYRSNFGKVNSVRKANERNKVSICDRKLYVAERGTLLYKIQMAKGVYGD
jgi:hypothetical protein